MNVSKKYNRGFTLIELLVVIAIIGILSSVVLASLNTARLKGRDAAVQSNLNTVRSEMELYYTAGESYGLAGAVGTDICDTPSAPERPFTSVTNIANALASAEANGGGDAVCAVGPDGNNWAASVPLAGGGSWCVTSIGVSQNGTASGGGGSDAFCN